MRSAVQAAIALIAGCFAFGSATAAPFVAGYSNDTSGGGISGFFISGLATTGNGAPPAITVGISNITIQNVDAQSGAGGLMN
jgi:hypothetical protein